MFNYLNQKRRLSPQNSSNKKFAFFHISTCLRHLTLSATSPTYSLTRISIFMSRDEDSFLENLTTLTLAIGERQDLRDWFHQLSEKPADQRAEAIFEMIERIAAEGDDAELASSVKWLTDPRIFDATRLALQQCNSAKQ